MSAETSAIFLSYARDDAVSARRIAEALRAGGLEVWFDENELRGGDAWDAKIRQQIDDCTLFVPIISKHTEARAKGYFRLEWKLAVDQTHLLAEGVPFIAPVVIDHTREKGARVPAEFLRVQWTRLPDALPTPQLVGQMRRLLERTPAAEMTAVPMPMQTAPAFEVAPPPPPVAKRMFPVALVVALAVAVLALVAYIALRPGAKDHAPAVTAAKVTVEPKPAATLEKSVAVLPFVNLGADKADEYLGDGMTEELLNVLAKVRGLRVPGRSSSFAFKGRADEDIFRKVGEKLHVSTVLEGSVRKTGNRLRITAQLINVADGFHLWSETYDRDMSDILGVQTDVAQRVVQALQVELGVEETRALTKRSTANPAAFELYLKGRFAHYEFTESSSNRAIDYFKQAIALDPTYAQAHAGMAAIYAQVSSVSMPPNEAMPIAKRYVVKALALDDSLAEAHHSLACVKWWGDWDFAGAEREFRRAIELNLNDARPYSDFMRFLLQQGRFDEGRTMAATSARLDPQFLCDRSYADLYSGRYDQALATAKLAVEQGITPVYAHYLLSRVFIGQGKFDEALREAQQARNLTDDPRAALDYATALACIGRKEEARPLLDEMVQLSKRIYVSPVAIGGLYALLGERETAFEWLERGYEGRSDHLLTLNISPVWDGIRSDPRFVALVEKVGLPKITAPAR